MATITVGSNATTTLTGVTFGKGLSAADIAAIANGILNEGSADSGQLAKTAPSAKPILPGAFSLSGLLYIPNRGVLQALPGDIVAIDANGWPILISANAIAGGTSPSATSSWTHT